MERKRSRSGFTMAELLIVVGILVVLFGLGFVAVQRYQRSMTQMEYDTIAKEIFVAAQNHLVIAESQGYLGKTDFGTEDEESEIVGDYYLLVNGAIEKDSVPDQMLPFGSIDETIRAGGSYIIHYQPSSATVLDVFYSNDSRTSALTSKGTILSGDDYSQLMSDTYYGPDSEQKQARQTFPGNNGTGVVGWFGDSDSLPKGNHLDAPVVKIHNEEKLWVEVTNPNSSGSLVLLVTGRKSNAQCKFTLGSTEERVVGNNYNCVILDDITAEDMRFAEIAGQTKDENGADLSFIPGEDLFVEAVAFDNGSLTNVAYSGKQTTNSLFRSIDLKTIEGTATPIARIENFRHLENLDPDISGFSSSTCYQSGAVTHAEQIKNLVWSGNDSFQSEIYTLNQKNIVYVPSSNDAAPAEGEASVYSYKSGSAVASNVGCYLPVSTTNVDLTYSLTYSGNNHSISKVTVNCADNAGLFGTLGSAVISDLELIDFSILSVSDSGNAGTLAGTLNNSTVSNVLARNSSDAAAVNVSASGSAGGLIGNMSGGTIQYSAAAVITGSRTRTEGSGDTPTTTTVTPTDAGGLIGTASSTITGCYSGGHTSQGSYSEWIGVSGHSYDVTGTTAGGLIGSFSGATIENSYSTCSVSGTRAGGFIGTGSGSITNCYCTGRISGTTIGAFAGGHTGTTSPWASNCKYFEIINEIPPAGGVKTYTYLLPVYLESGAANDVAGITAFDATESSYDTFIGGPGDWTEAEPYDSTLGEDGYYQGKYNLQSVARLGSTVPANYYVNTHYGDWPAPEIFVINEKSN